MIKRRAYSKTYRNPKVFSARVRESRAQKSRGKILKSIFRALIIIVIVLAIYFLFSHEALVIKNVKIKGDSAFIQKVEEISKNELNNSRFLIFKNNNYFLFNSSKLKKDLFNEIKELKEITIYRNFPNGIEISLREKKPKLGWEIAGKGYLIDEDGEVIKETSDFTGFLIVKDINNLPIKDKKVVYPDFISFIEELSNKLKNSNLTIDHIEIKETTFIISIISKEGPKLMFDTTKSLNDQIIKLEEALKQIGEQRNKLDYIDLTVKNKAIYKFK